MKLVDKYLSFVNEQATFQERMAEKYAATPWRQERHLKSAAQFKELADDIILATSRLNELPAEAVKAEATKSGSIARKISLTLADIDGLPDELMRELSISESDRVEFTIVSIIENGGGILSLDKILIDLYKKTGEIHKRTPLTSRLYRMVQKGILFQVPNKKGLYSTEEVTEQDARKLFGQDDEQAEEAQPDNVSQISPGLADRHTKSLMGTTATTRPSSPLFPRRGS